MRLLLVPLLFIAISASVALTLGSQFEIPGSFAEAVAWLRSFERWLWAVAMAVIIGDFLLPLPSTPALVSLGIVYGPLLGGLIGGVATSLAGLLAFGFTRALGERGALYLVGERDLQRARRFYDRWGVYAVTLGRAIGGPFEWLVLIAGLSGMPFGRAFLALVLGGFSAAFVTAGLGDLAADRPALALGLIFGLALALAWLGRRMLSAGSQPSSEASP